MNNSGAFSNIIFKLATPLLGKKRFQSFFKFLYILSLNGMNFMRGGFTGNKGELNALKRLKLIPTQPKNLIFFDVGANVGIYTNQILQVFDKNVNIYSFEPSLPTFKELQINLKSADNVKAYNLGLGEHNEKRRLYRDSDLSGLASVYFRDLSHISSELSFSIEEDIHLVKLDEFCVSNQIEEIFLLKIDVEGHELSVLKGATEMIKSKKIHHIQFEFGSTSLNAKTSLHDFWKLLSEYYDFYRIVEDGEVLIPVYREFWEVAATINYMLHLKK